MKIQLGIRGSSDSMNHILVKIDDLILMNKDNLFLAGNEGRDKTGKSLVELLNTLSKDHEICVSENVANLIESELNLKNNSIKKFIENYHTLSYERHGRKGIGHGKLWKAICREIGAIPRACSKAKLNKPNNHYKYIDTCCGLTFKRHRLRKNVSYSCPKCRVDLFVSKGDKIASRATLDLIDEIFSE
jgi:hypothetical protein